MQEVDVKLILNINAVILQSKILIYLYNVKFSFGQLRSASESLLFVDVNNVSDNNISNNQLIDTSQDVGHEVSIKY